MTYAIIPDPATQYLEKVLGQPRVVEKCLQAIGTEIWEIVVNVVRPV